MQLNDRREGRDQPKVGNRGLGAGGVTADSPAQCLGSNLNRPAPPPTPQVDADFFNAFEDDADESDMRPGP